jgi:hypothetical protein
MPDLGPLGRGGARRRTRRRMTLVNDMENSKDQDQPSESEEYVVTDVHSDKLEKLAKLLKDKGVISETEYNLIFD